MKRPYVILFVIGLLLGGTAVFADEAILIDFSKLSADQTLGTNKTPTENGATLIDYSGIAGASFTDDQKATLKSSLSIGNWQVTLASSARSINNQSLTMVKEAAVSASAKQFNGQDMAGKKVLGVRIHFPVEPYNSWAMITPPFDIPAYADKDTLQSGKMVIADKDKGLGEKFLGFGIVKNVGVLRSLSITVYGANFKNGLGVIVADADGNEQTMFMDYLQFDGWRTLTWDNPNYVSDVRNRELRRTSLYPKGVPFVRLVGIVIYRDASQEGGDFVTYVKDVKITYDKALLDAQPRDINDEAVWGILQQRSEARRLAELKRLGSLQILRFLEQQKMDASNTPAQ